ALRGGIHRVLSCPSSCLRAPIPCPGSSDEASAGSGTAASSGSPCLSALSRDRGSNYRWCVRKTELSARPDLRTSARQVRIADCRRGGDCRCVRLPTASSAHIVKSGQAVGLSFKGPVCLHCSTLRADPSSSDTAPGQCILHQRS